MGGATGGLYAAGEEVPKEVPKGYRNAIEWDGQASARGISVTQDRVWVRYAYGLGVTRNYVQVMRWVRAAAAQNDSDGQDALGVLSVHGWGVPRSHMGALRRFRRAREVGGAGRLPGLHYAAGSGVKRNYRLAFAWAELSTEPPDPARYGAQIAKARALHLTTAQFEADDRFIRRWRVGQDLKWRAGCPQCPPAGSPARNRSIAPSASGSSSSGAWPRPGTVSDSRSGFSRRIRSSISGLRISDSSPRITSMARARSCANTGHRSAGTAGADRIASPIIGSKSSTGTPETSI